jgi:hypothetical protein
VEEAGVVADGFRHATQKRNNLVFNFALDLANAGDVEASLFFNSRDGRFGHLSQLSQALSGKNFHIEPLLKAVLLGPDTAHLRPRVPRDHASN